LSRLTASAFSGIPGLTALLAMFSLVTARLLTLSTLLLLTVAPVIAMSRGLPVLIILATVLIRTVVICHG